MRSYALDRPCRPVRPTSVDGAPVQTAPYAQQQPKTHEWKTPHACVKPKGTERQLEREASAILTAFANHLNYGRRVLGRADEHRGPEDGESSVLPSRLHAEMRLSCMTRSEKLLKLGREGLCLCRSMLFSPHRGLPAFVHFLTIAVPLYR